MVGAVLGVGASNRAFLSGLSKPPSVAEVTTAIVVMQTIIGLFGSWIAGTEVKSIIKGSTKRHAIGAIWSIFLHGEIRHSGDNGIDPNQVQHFATTGLIRMKRNRFATTSSASL